MNLPNRLTMGRLVMVPVFVLLCSFDHVATYAVAYVVFVAASITDYYDGKIARSRNLVTNFGKLFDPVADKVLLSAAFVMLMEIPGLHIPAWTIVVIIAREFLVTGARSLAATDGVVIAANSWGKTKAVIQMTYIFTFLFFVIVERAIAHWLPDGIVLYREALGITSYWAILFVALFTAFAGVQFARLNWRALNLGRLT